MPDDTRTVWDCLHCGKPTSGDKGDHECKPQPSEASLKAARAHWLSQIAHGGVRPSGQMRHDIGLLLMSEVQPWIDAAVAATAQDYQSGAAWQEMRFAYDKMWGEKLDAEHARGEKLAEVVVYPKRDGAVCRWCGQFSSAQSCNECNFRLSQMPGLLSYLTAQQTAYDEWEAGR